MKILTSESVNIGHPDKTCDVIADCFLDAALSEDENSQMAVECAIKNNKLFIYGEATTKAKINYDEIAKKVLKYVGYDAENFEIIKELSHQSPDINSAVVKNTEIAANDQGIIFGYACSETENYMPKPFEIANKLMMEYENFRLKNKNFFADAKSQVSVEYENDKPVRVNTILLSVSHSEKLTLIDVRNQILTNVVKPVLKQFNAENDNPKILINAGGKFTVWGSFADSGCVGRKIVVDSYGGFSRVGGGCFSSKNASKVDRSAAYYLRYVAKNLVANNLTEKVELQISYGFGLTEPISFNIETFGTEKVELSKIYEIVKNNFNFKPQKMMQELKLNKPVFAKTACYGHFGRDFEWEKIKKLNI